MLRKITNFLQGKFHKVNSVDESSASPEKGQNTGTFDQTLRTIGQSLSYEERDKLIDAVFKVRHTPPEDLTLEDAMHGLAAMKLLGPDDDGRPKNLGPSPEPSPNGKGDNKSPETLGF